jgi:FkbM family methyltransferase
VAMPEKLRAVATTTRLSALVRERVRFWLRVATRRHGVARYHLRGSGVVVHLRHGTVDVMTLEQIAAAGHYEPPPNVAAILDAAGPELRVVDLGANIGMFGAYIRGCYPQAAIVAFEPHPANVEVLKRTAAANDGDWRVMAACADVGEGTVPFWIGGEFTTSRIEAGSSDTIDVPAVDVFPYLAQGDLLKIDIEGAEWKILDDPRFASLDAPVVALEYHAYACPGPDPRAYARNRLEEVGYAVADAELAAEPGHGMLWAWRSS